MRMKVAFSSSDAYAHITYISIESLFRCNKDADEITVYLVEEKMSDPAKAKMLELAGKYGREIRLIPLDNVVGGFEDILPSWGGSRNLCFKLFLSQCPEFGDADTVLCLESDMITCAPLTEIFETDMTGKYVAGVGNPINLYKQPELYSEDYPMYLNGGLNYFNLALMREDGVQSRLNEFMRNNQNLKATVFCERIYNILFADKIRYLPTRYNIAPYMLYFSAKKVAVWKNNPHSHTKAEIDAAIGDPAIIHYAGALQYIRPWYKNSDHPMKDIFLKQNESSDWPLDVSQPMKISGSQRKRNFKHLLLKLMPCGIARLFAKSM